MRGIVVALFLLAACGGAGAAAPIPTPTTAGGPRLSAANQAALTALAASGPAVIGADGHDHGGHGTWGPVTEAPADPATAISLDAQWAAAVGSTAWLSTTDDAERAGYQKASAEAPGVGAHYVRWDLVDAPFDPARPAMLLYDESTQRPTRLAGFSYWVRSPGGPPEGFAGPNDVWHAHAGMCFDDGFLVREGVADAAGCDGTWLAGTDLWMLHAWVDPDVPNPWGRFAERNPAVCPSAGEQVPDVLRCPGQAGSSAGAS